MLFGLTAQKTLFRLAWTNFQCQHNLRN